MRRSRGQELAFRALVRARDGDRCRRCGRPATIVHHIAHRTQRPDLIYEPTNGCVVCQKCHDWAHLHATPDEAEAAGLLSRERYENRAS